MAFAALCPIDHAEFYDSKGNGDDRNPQTVVISAKNIFPGRIDAFRHRTPLVLALKSYKRIRMLFFGRPGSPFTGLREFHNQYVHISFEKAPAPQSSPNGPSMKKSVLPSLIRVFCYGRQPELHPT